MSWNRGLMLVVAVVVAPTGGTRLPTALPILVLSPLLRGQTGGQQSGRAFALASGFLL